MTGSVQLLRKHCCVTGERSTFNFCDFSRLSHLNRFYCTGVFAANLQKAEPLTQGQMDLTTQGHTNAHTQPHTYTNTRTHTRAQTTKMLVGTRYKCLLYILV